MCQGTLANVLGDVWLPDTLYYMYNQTIIILAGTVEEKNFVGEKFHKFCKLEAFCENFLLYSIIYCDIIPYHLVSDVGDAAVAYCDMNTFTPHMYM